MAARRLGLSRLQGSRWIRPVRARVRGVVAADARRQRRDNAARLRALKSPTMRKPFDVLAEGLLVSSSRGDKI